MEHELAWCEMPTSTSTIATGTAANKNSSVISSIYNMSCHWCSISSRLSHCMQYMHQLWLFRLRRTVCISFSIICGLGSVLILWSEMVLASELRSPVAYLMGAYNTSFSNESSVLVQGVAFIFLAYMSICTYWSLFRINLGWAYSLQGPQQSSPSSMIFNAEYFSRLQFTLGYNFLVILHAAR